MRTMAVATLLLLAGLSALATPSTLITIPSTDIQPTGVWHLGVDSLVYTGGNEAPASFVDLGLTYGLTPRIEVGVDFVSGFDNPLWLNAKVQLLSPEQAPVAMAAGIYNYSTADASNQEVKYVIASRAFDQFRVHLGGFAANDELFGDDDTGILGGVEYTAAAPWWFAVDYFSGENPLGSLNLGVGYALTDKIGVILGYDIYNDDVTPDSVNFQLDVKL